MYDKLIERALACRLIDQYLKRHELTATLTDEHLARASWHILDLLRSFEVRTMYDENTFRGIDVERVELYEIYSQTLVERFAGAWLDEHGNTDEPLTEEHLCDLIGDFQDIVWNGYGDNAIQVD